MLKKITHDRNNLIILHQCSSTGVSKNMQLCSMSFKGFRVGTEKVLPLLLVFVSYFRILISYM